MKMAVSWRHNHDVCLPTWRHQQQATARIKSAVKPEVMYEHAHAAKKVPRRRCWRCRWRRRASWPDLRRQDVVRQTNWRGLRTNLWSAVLWMWTNWFNWLMIQHSPLNIFVLLIELPECRDRVVLGPMHAVSLRRHEVLWCIAINM